MDQVTQQNAALVEQSAAASDSLRAQAEQLVSAVSVFKLGAAEHRAAAVAAPARDSAARRSPPPAIPVKRPALRQAKAASAAPATAPIASPAGTGDWTSF